MYPPPPSGCFSAVHCEHLHPCASDVFPASCAPICLIYQAQVLRSFTKLGDLYILKVTKQPPDQLQDSVFFSIKYGSSVGKVCLVS